MRTLATLSSFTSAFEKATRGRYFSELFDDFLTLCMHSITKLPHLTTQPFDEDYATIIEDYKRTNTLEELLQMRQIFFSMIAEKVFVPDLMGDFYNEIVAEEEEKRILTPYHLCLDIAGLFSHEMFPGYDALDTQAGSGRMLIALSKYAPKNCFLLGRDSDPILCKLAAVNLFMYGLKGETICTEENTPVGFLGGYAISSKGIDLVTSEDKSKAAYRISNLKKEKSDKRILFV